jgi:hypothetical protein
MIRANILAVIGFLAAGSAAGQEGSFVLCARYEFMGGCSQTSEYMSALAWVRLTLGPEDRAELALRVRSHDSLTGWNDPGGSFYRGQQLLDLRWSGTFSRPAAGGQDVVIELQAPAGEDWDRWQTDKGYFLPRDERPAEGMRLECALSTGKALTCRRPAGDDVPLGHLSRLAHYLFEEGVLELPAAPGVYRERSEDRMSVRGVLPGGEPVRPGPPALDAVLAEARASPHDPVKTRERQAAALLAVCDPGAELPPEGLTWLRAPAPSAEEQKQLEELRKKRAR